MLEKEIKMIFIIFVFVEKKGKRTILVCAFLEVLKFRGFTQKLLTWASLPFCRPLVGARDHASHHQRFSSLAFLSLKTIFVIFQNLLESLESKLQIAFEIKIFWLFILKIFTKKLATRWTPWHHGYVIISGHFRFEVDRKWASWGFQNVDFFTD